MDENKLMETLDAEFQAVRIGLKVLTAFISAQHPNGAVATAFEEAVGELRGHPEAPERAVEYLEQMAEVARRAVSEE